MVLSISFTPAFSPTVYSYDALVGFTVDEFLLTATLADTLSTFTVRTATNVYPGSTGQESSYPLSEGTNRYNVTVVAQNGQNRTVYSLRIIRQSCKNRTEI